MVFAVLKERRRQEQQWRDRSAWNSPPLVETGLIAIISQLVLRSRAARAKKIAATKGKLVECAAERRRTAADRLRRTSRQAACVRCVCSGQADRFPDDRCGQQPIRGDVSARPRLSRLAHARPQATMTARERQRRVCALAYRSNSARRPPAQPRDLRLVLGC